MVAPKSLSKQHLKAIKKFHAWRDGEMDRLVRLGCSKAYAETFLAPWYLERVGSWFEAGYMVRGGDNEALS